VDNGKLYFGCGNGAARYAYPFMDDDKAEELLAEFRHVARRMTSVLVTGFMVTITLLLGLSFEWLRWHGALAPVFPKP
jgi:hypothetical protein